MAYTNVSTVKFNGTTLNYVYYNNRLVYGQADPTACVTRLDVCLYFTRYGPPYGFRVCSAIVCICHYCSQTASNRYLAALGSCMYICIPNREGVRTYDNCCFSLSYFTSRSSYYSMVPTNGYMCFQNDCRLRICLYDCQGVYVCPYSCIADICTNYPTKIDISTWDCTATMYWCTCESNRICLGGLSTHYIYIYAKHKLHIKKRWPTYSIHRIRRAA